MSGLTRLDHVRRLFADQFERDGDGYLYRQNQRKAPVRVSVAERDRFVHAFNRRLGFIFWGLLAGMILAITAKVAIEVALGLAPIDGETYLILGAFGLVYMVVWWRLWNAPARAVRGRSVVGPARSARQVRARSLQRLPWSSVAAALVGALWLIAKGLGSPEGAARWAWIIAGGALFVLLIVQSVRKAMYARRN